MVNIIKAKAEKNINNFILEKLNNLWISSIFVINPIFILADKYLDDPQKIATYPITLR